MKLKKAAFFLMLGFCFMQTLGYADMWWCEVQNIYDEGNALVMKRLNLEKGGLDEVKVRLSLMTNLNGIGTIYDLKNGDTVWVEVEQNQKTGAWQARSISVAPQSV